MVTLYTDGLCEPVNPGGYACWAWVAVDANGEEVAHDYGCLGKGPGMTNNLAEYHAVCEALAWAVGRGLEGVVVKTDSQLVVKQVCGGWSIRAPALIPLVEKARRLLAQTGGRVEWVPRERTWRADILSYAAYMQVYLEGLLEDP